jgi:hypothetical protein
MTGISGDNEGRGDATVRAASLVEVLLPLPVSHAWVSHACRAAAIEKPRWNHVARFWYAEARGPDRTIETITIATGRSPRFVRVSSDRAESETARRVVSAFLVGMQAEVARRRGS